eukprot:CAMPEP_0177650448 /NCGR_PEP_ID=MMETSP0447-20121125/11949_1 /TAXON_ID=0 /ORGANISM="Stygamoeba regulata, Strain BSH-02190019" /LENGTH=332 /DNA_ID=CAMNT_0019153321 /DNA_START=122 /DNA_END=1120 /DNA_ORIENTATION=-
MKDPGVPEILVKIIKRYDLIFIQEIRDDSDTAIHELLEKVNYRLRNKYSLLLSERLGRTDSKEQYAYLYKEASLKPIQVKQWDDRSDNFERPPYIVKWDADGLAFITVGCHIKPDHAYEELQSMYDVWLSVRKSLGSDAGLIMGDFNADCGYLSNRKYESLDLVRKPGYKWLIDKGEDTTTGSSDCAYDRFVVTEALENAARSPGIFHFDTAYKLSSAMTAEVSDHYPIELTLRTSAAVLSRQHSQALQGDDGSGDAAGDGSDDSDGSSSGWPVHMIALVVGGAAAAALVVVVCVVVVAAVVASKKRKSRRDAYVAFGADATQPLRAGGDEL